MLRTQSQATAVACLVIFPFDHYFYEIPYCLSITKLSFSCWFIVSGWFHLVKFYLLSLKLYFATVQFSRSVVSDSLWSHGLHHIRLSYPSPTPRACSNSCLLSWWCHPTISSSVAPFSSCLQSFPASGLFQWLSSSHQVAKILELQLQHQSMQWIFRTDFL